MTTVAPAATARPDFFIVGAAKCGTTALYTYLGQHPDVFMPCVKETSFHAPDFYTPPHRRLTLEGYLELFAGAQHDQHVGEAATRYLISKQAAQRIHAFQPTARIIAMLRNPVEMMHSLHAQLVYQGIEPLEDFSAALAAGDERREVLATHECPPLNRFLVYRDAARYSEQLERYVSLFGRDRIHVILFDEFARDTPRAYRRVLEFLGADPSFEAQLEVVNQYKATRSRRLHDFLVRPAGPLQTIVQHALPRRLRRQVTGKVRALNTRPERRPDMPPDLRRRLEDEFADEVTKLEGLLDRDLSAWRSRSA